MGELPTWWRWVEPDDYSAPLGSTAAVFGADDVWAACVQPNGSGYDFRIAAGAAKASADVEGHIAGVGEDYAKRACERVYVAVMGALEEVSRG